MKPTRWLLSEWKTVLRSPKTLVPLLGILFIPVLYSGTYLWAFWDPYAHVERLPVAVVNEDRSVVYEGRTYAIGNDLTDEMKRDPAFEWHFVDRAEAESGLASYRYYFEVLIPADFSARATSLTSAQPTPLELVFKANEGVNYSVSRIGQTGVEQIRQKLSQRLIETYTERMFAELDKLRSGLQQASDGSRQLADGIRSAGSGAEQLIAAMSGKATAVSQLAQGAADAGRGTGQLAQGAAALKSGAVQVADGSAQLGDGLAAAQVGSGKLAAGLAQASAGARQLDAAVKAYVQQHPELSGDAGFKPIAALGAQLAGGASEWEAAAGSLGSGIAELSGKQAQLTEGARQLADKAQQLASGAASLQSGSAAIADGAKQLADGWSGVIANLRTLSDGLSKLIAGSEQLSGSLADGAQQLDRIHGSQPLYAMLANPIRLKEESVHRLPNYGTGMAPFFIAVSLYVGALLLSTVFPLRETATPPSSGFLWFLSKFAVLAALSLGQVVIACLVLVYAVGLAPLSAFDMGWFTFVCSVAFMTIIQLLVTALDNVGRFIGIVVLVLQLTATSGTFPVELVPRALQIVHAFLPITYAVEGLRTIISTGDTGLLRSDTGMLALFAAVAAVLTVLLMTRQVRLRRRRGEASG